MSRKKKSRLVKKKKKGWASVPRERANFCPKKEEKKEPTLPMP